MRFNCRRRNFAGYVQLKFPSLCTDVRFNQWIIQLNEQSHINEFVLKDKTRSSGKLLKGFSSMEAIALPVKSRCETFASPAKASREMCVILFPDSHNRFKCLRGAKAPLLFSTIHEIKLLLKSLKNIN